MTDHPYDHDALDLSPAARAAIAEALQDTRPFPGVPGSVDRAVQADARRTMRDRLARRTTVLWTIRAGAAVAAAGLALAVWTLGPWRGATRTTPGVQSPRIAAAGPEDIDSNGRVDILDALAIARALDQRTRAKAPIPASWDVNHDGVVDERDVEQVAAAAVRITPTPPVRG